MCWVWAMPVGSQVIKKTMGCISTTRNKTLPNKMLLNKVSQRWRSNRQAISADSLLYKALRPQRVTIPILKRRRASRSTSKTPQRPTPMPSPTPSEHWSATPWPAATPTASRSCAGLVMWPLRAPVNSFMWYCEITTTKQGLN